MSTSTDTLFPYKKRFRSRFGPFTAVDGVQFGVDRGEVLGFLGPNGAGKSTTMKMITGFLTPTAGRIVVCGHDVVEDPIAAKRSEEHTSELQSLMRISYAVFCLKKKQNRTNKMQHTA